MFTFLLSIRSKIFTIIKKLFMKNKITTILLFIIFSILLFLSLFFFLKLKRKIITPQKNDFKTVNIWLTTPDKKNLIKNQSSISFQNNIDDKTPAIIIDATKKKQKIVGFGASLTDTSAYLISKIPDETVKEMLMQNLFDKNHGIGISILRQPIGTSDFARNYYTYDDLPSKKCATSEDLTLKCFSIEKDLGYIIPLLKHALTISKLEIIASPWSPPAWMKSNNSLIGNFKNGGNLIPKYYGSYAEYIVNFINSYKEQGININYLSVQNEPGYLSNYPGMNFPASEQISFIKNYLVPSLAKANLSPQLLIFDYNYDSKNPEFNKQNFDQFMSIFKNSNIPNLSTAIHCYGELPDRALVLGELFLTECSTSISKKYATSSAKPLSPADLIIDAAKSGASSVLFWNIAEDQNNGPRADDNSRGCKKCTPLVTINNDNKGKVTNNISFNPEFFSLGHFAKFIGRNANYIDSNELMSGNAKIKNAVFLNPDGSTVLVAHNEDAVNAHKIKVIQSKSSFEYILPAGSIATFKW